MKKCSISIAIALEMLRSCTKPSIYGYGLFGTEYYSMVLLGSPHDIMTSCHGTAFNIGGTLIDGLLSQSAKYVGRICFCKSKHVDELSPEGAALINSITLMLTSLTSMLPKFVNLLTLTREYHCQSMFARFCDNVSSHDDLLCVSYTVRSWNMTAGLRARVSFSFS